MGHVELVTVCLLALVQFWVADALGLGYNFTVHYIFASVLLTSQTYPGPQSLWTDI